MTELTALIPLLVVALFSYGMFRLIKGRSGGKADGTTKCRDCKADIPSNATKCMHCGAKQKIGKLGLILIVLLLILIGQCTLRIQSNKNTSAPKLTPEQLRIEQGKTPAMKLCIKYIRSVAKFPSSVDISFLRSPGAQPIATGGYSVQVIFEANNSFGILIPQMATCKIMGGKVKQFNVRNR